MAELSILKIEQEIRREHQASIEGAVSSIKHAVRCGELLIGLRSSVEDGEWCRALERIGIARSTANNYERLARTRNKFPKKFSYLLERGAELVDLYRAFDLVKPVTPGGYKSDVYQRRKLGEQLELDFSFEEAIPHFESLSRAKNVESLAPSSLQRLLTECESAAARLRELLANAGAISLEVQP